MMVRPQTNHCIRQATGQVETDVDSIDITVMPKIMYKFQAAAREDKGIIGGVNWNKSPAVEFKTSSNHRKGGNISSHNG